MIILLATLLFAAWILRPTRGAAQPAPVQALIERGAQAGADAEMMQAVADRATRSGLDAASTADLLRPAVRLAEQSLPAEPVLGKALEGLAKRVPAGRMTPVLHRMQAYTEQAGMLVSTWTRRPEVQALIGASASDAGSEGMTPDVRHELIRNVTRAQQQDVPLEQVRTLLEALPGATERRPLPPRGIAVALSVLPDLPGAQRASGAAQQLLTAALDAGYSPDDLRQLPVALQSAQQRSARAADVIARLATQAIARGTPAADVLQGLLQGDVPGGPPAGAGGPPDGGLSGERPDIGKGPPTGGPSSSGGAGG